MGQRRVDLKSLFRLALRAGLGHVLPRPGVVEAVGQLDDQHPHILSGRYHHLADGLGLRGLPVLDLVEFCHPIHQLGDLRTEFLGQLRQGVGGIFHGVVEKSRR